MAKLRLTLACDSYDYLSPLREGRIEVDGIDLNLVTVESGIRHQRMFHHGEYDVCEFSMSSYLVARSQDIDWFEAIPFFTRRMFGHKFCFLRTDAEVRRPADLKGARIGLRSYENTLALMVKGMFMAHYDLPVDSVTWVCVNKELVGSKPGANIKIEHVEGGKSLEGLLVDGEVQAEVEPDLPAGWLGVVVGFGTTVGKIAAFMFLFIWLRATFPRLREDQLQRLSWLVLIPLAILQIVVVAIFKVVA